MKNKKIAIVIQARNNSTRLKGKILKKILNKTVIEYQIERLKKCKKVNDIIIATTFSDSEKNLIKLCKKINIPFFRGSTNDLLDRHYQLAKKYNLDYIVRIPGDNPLPEAKEIDKIIDYHIKSNNAFSSNLSNVLDNGYPDGVGAEVYSFWAIKQKWQTVRSLTKREHIHLCFLNKNYSKAVDNKKFKIGTIISPKSIKKPDLRLDINTSEDFAFIKKIIEGLYPKNQFFNTKDIISFLKKRY